MVEDTIPKPTIRTGVANEAQRKKVEEAKLKDIKFKNFLFQQRDSRDNSRQTGRWWCSIVGGKSKGDEAAYFTKVHIMFWCWIKLASSSFKHNLSKGFMIITSKLIIFL